MSFRWGLLRTLIDKAVEEGVFPGACACIWHRGSFVLFHYAGHAQTVPEMRDLKGTTFFDLSSLTKPLACGLIMMRMVETRQIGLDDKLHKFLGVPSDKRDITIAQLLSHSAGFSAWHPLYLNRQGMTAPVFAKSALSQILSRPLEYEAGKGYVYSDLGYIVLGAVIEKVSRMSLAALFSRLADELEVPNLIFVRHEHKKPGDLDFAATEKCSWRKRVIVGEVHDENAWAMGGVSAHAGLFGTARDVCKLGAQLLTIFLGSKGPLKTETVKLFWTYKGRGTHKLAWDSPSAKGSSAGDFLSLESVGHTGFSGTSIWIDPARELVCVLLTNRIHPTRNNDKIKDFRPKFHNLMIKIIENMV